MAEQVTKHLEIETYTHLGISVRVKINYDRAKISLLDSNGDAKKWVFADRELGYIAGWRNILAAMEHAISEAEKKLQKHEAKRLRAEDRKALEIARIVAKK